MFRDLKLGGYNLEITQVSDRRLVATMLSSPIYPLLPSVVAMFTPAASFFQKDGPQSLSL